MSEAVKSLDRRVLHRWRNAIILAFCLGGITIASWGPRLPAVKSELDVTTGTLGVLLACVTVGSIAGLLSSTPVLHWLGSRRALGAALLVVAVAMAGMGLAVLIGSVPLVTAAFVVVGFGIGLLDVLINVEGSAVERAAGRTLMPLLHGAWSVGAAIGAGIGAGCAALGITASTQFVGIAVLIAVCAFVVMPAIAPGTRVDEHPVELTRWQRVVGWARGWLDWRLLMIGVILLGVELGEGSANNWLTLAAHHDHGVDAALAAAFLTVFAIAEATTRILAGPVVDRIGRVATIRYTTALGVIGVVLFIFGGNIVLIVIGVVLWAVGVSMGFPLGMSAAAESGPNPAARVSVVASIGYFASLAGPPAVGMLAEHTGLTNAFWLLVALFAAAFAASGALRRPR